MIREYLETDERFSEKEKEAVPTGIVRELVLIE